MTASILDELPGVGPARKRALLKHFGSPDAILAASREELEAVPGTPGQARARRVPRAAQDRASEPPTRPYCVSITALAAGRSIV